MSSKSTNDAVEVFVKDFVKMPILRHIDQGPYSGEEFRQKKLEPHFAGGDKSYKVIVVLDQVIGYSASFLEEAFGGLVREFGFSKVNSRIEVVSHEEPHWITRIQEWMDKMRRTGHP